MRKYKFNLNDGNTVELEARKFSVYLNGIQYNFLFHNGINRCEKTITHLESNLRVIGMPTTATLDNAKLKLQSLFRDERKLDILKRAVISARN